MNNIIFSNQPPALQPSNSETITKKKINIKELKNNTLNSLNEVENFLNDFHRLKKYIKLYRIIK